LVPPSAPAEAPSALLSAPSFFDFDLLAWLPLVFVVLSAL